jgi:acetyl-CoA carboxylase biotin carboxyl carrier protein
MSESESVKVETDAEGAGEATSERGGSRRRRSRSLSAESSVNMDELRELIQLIRENDFTEFELEREGFRVRFRRGPAVIEGAAGGVGSFADSGPAPASRATGPGSAASNQPAAKAETAADENLHIITSPIVGTFYRAASPQAPPFVNIGSRVEPGTVVCIIEAMKLMNEILAESSGEVAKIYVENGQPVEYGQPLFGIKN